MKNYIAISHPRRFIDYFKRHTSIFCIFLNSHHMDQTEPIPKTHHQGRVQKYIDDTLAGLLDAMSNANGNPSITLRRRSGNLAFHINPNSGALETTSAGSLVTYSWPGKDCFEAWRFSEMISTMPLQTQS